MPILILIVFVDLLGFGLLLPLLPFYVQRVGASPGLITIVLGLYSLAQFVAGPIWGRLSDKHGRKPILALTSLGLAVSYVMLAYADNLEWLIVSRIFGGLMAGNLGAAQAYASDITTPETRARAMGLIGAAFALGFIFGPAIGGVLGGGDLAHTNFFLPAMAAAAVTAVAAAATVVFLPESLTAEQRKARPTVHASLPQRLRLIGTRRTLLLLTVAGFLSVTAWAQFETVFSLWANAEFHLGPRQIGLMIGYIGVIGVIIQGGATGRLTKAFGEWRLLVAGFVMLAIGYALIAAASTIGLVFVALSALSIGVSLQSPSISSAISKEAASHERGVVLGTYQGLTALGRVIGPAFSGTVFAQLGSHAPFLVGLALTIPALACLLMAPREHHAP